MCAVVLSSCLPRWWWTTVLLDQILPGYHVHEVHSVAVNAPASQVFAAVRAVAPNELPLFRLLMTTRSLPALAVGRRPSFRSGGDSLLDQARKAGFVILGEDVNRELVLGAIGRPWRLSGSGQLPAIRSADEFAAFTTPGFAKIATNFRFEESASQSWPSRLSTETRVWLTDPASMRRFRGYWSLIRPGSGLIRREWLRRIKQRAEAAAQPQ